MRLGSLEARKLEDGVTRRGIGELEGLKFGGKGVTAVGGYAFKTYDSACTRGSQSVEDFVPVVRRFSSRERGGTTYDKRGWD
jgi:hypothetical protein